MIAAMVSIDTRLLLLSIASLCNTVGIVALLFFKKDK